MGKNLNGKELGKGLYQRKDGRYEARIFVRGTENSWALQRENDELLYTPGRRTHRRQYERYAQKYGTET